jgi:hypothetical protein
MVVPAGRGDTPDSEPTGDVGDRFLSTFLAGVAPTLAPELLPTQLAVACTQLLPIEGAGLCLISRGYRVPLGASSEAAAAAERLQFTVGEGPCLQAVHEVSEIRANESDTARRWPLYYDELVRQTPYRSIASVPLRITDSICGAVDLYFHDPDGAFTIDLADADLVAAQIANLLRANAGPSEPSTAQARALVPAWVHSPSSRRRMRTWIATGALMAHFKMNEPDALARLRAHAYSNEQDVDVVTDAIIDGSLAPENLRL